MSLSLDLFLSLLFALSSLAFAPLPLFLLPSLCRSSFLFLFLIRSVVAVFSLHKSICILLICFNIKVNSCLFVILTKSRFFFVCPLKVINYNFLPFFLSPHRLSLCALFERLSLLPCLFVLKYESRHRMQSIHCSDFSALFLLNSAETPMSSSMCANLHSFHANSSA